MKVALIGAPGSGKTRIAKALMKDPLFDGAKLVDNYVKNVEKRHDLACGSAGTWVANTAVAFERYGQERRVADAPHIITCGTLMETAVYESISAFAINTRPAAARATLVMNIVGAMILDTWRYDHVFYSPLGKGVTKHNTLVDEEIPLVLETMICDHVVLTRGSASARATEILDSLREVYANV